MSRSSIVFCAVSVFISHFLHGTPHNNKTKLPPLLCARVHTICDKNNNKRFDELKDCFYKLLYTKKYCHNLPDDIRQLRDTLKRAIPERRLEFFTEISVYAIFFGIILGTVSWYRDVPEGIFLAWHLTLVVPLIIDFLARDTVDYNELNRTIIKKVQEQLTL